MMEQRAKYPVGIQTFEKIREEGFLYADKTRFSRVHGVSGSRCS